MSFGEFGVLSLPAMEYFPKAEFPLRSALDQRSPVFRIMEETKNDFSRACQRIKLDGEQVFHIFWLGLLIVSFVSIAGVLEKNAAFRLTNW